MFNSLASRTLEIILNKYISNLEIDLLSIGLYQSNIILKNLKLKEHFQLFERNHKLLKLGSNGTIGNMEVSYSDELLVVKIEDAVIHLEAMMTDPNTGKKKKKTTENESAPPYETNENNASNNNNNNSYDSSKSNFLQTFLQNLAGYEFEFKNIIIHLTFFSDEPGDNSCECGLQFGISSLTFTDDYLDENENQNDGDINAQDSSSKHTLNSSQIIHELNTSKHYFVQKCVKIGGITDKGDIGLWLKLKHPSINKFQNCTKHKPKHWAIHYWDFKLFQISEVELKILFHLDYSNTDEELLDAVESSMNSALFGLNYDDGYREKYNTNDIQSLPIPSCFHRVYRGQRRTINLANTNPLSDGHWEFPKSKVPNFSSKSGVNNHKTNELDNRMPLPGFVIHVSVLVPLELNVDRESVDVLRFWIDFFSQHQSSSKSDINFDNMKIRDGKMHTNVGDRVNFDHHKNNGNFVELDEFPTFMAPSNVQVFGCHMSKFILRVHIMNSSRKGESGYQFGFFDLVMNSIDIDIQNLNADELKLTDVRLEVGRLEFHTFKGIERQRVLVAGFVYPTGRDDSLLEGMKTVQRREFAASAILNVAPMALTLEPQNSAVQMCYVCVNNSPSVSSSSPTGCIELRLGAFDCHLRDKFIDELMSSISEVKNIFSNDANISNNNTNSRQQHQEHPASKPTIHRAKVKTDWEYLLLTDGGVLNWKGWCYLDIPFLCLEGRKLTSGGKLFEWISDKVRMELSDNQSFIISPIQATPKPSLSSLPHEARMNMLLYLEDMSALEKALRLKATSSTFLRCHSVNRRLGKVASESRIRLISVDRKEEKALQRKIEKSRRREMLTRLMSFDNQALETMLIQLDRDDRFNVNRH